MRTLLAELFGNTSAHSTAEIIAKLDCSIPEIETMDPRLAHYLQRRSYHKALNHLHEVLKEQV